MNKTEPVSLAEARNREAASAATANNAVKADGGKPPMGLLPWPALIEVAKVLDHGARKYAKYNWLKGMEWSRLYDAALRHLVAWISGESKDEETNSSHLSHCLCCLLFLSTYEILGIGKDDRYKIEENTDLVKGKENA